MKSYDIHAVFSLLLFGQLPVRKNERISGWEADFDAIVRENERFSGRETDFDDVVRGNKRFSGREL